MIRSLHYVVFLFVLAGTFACNQKTTPDWPTISREHKPWTRWWWHGSALTKEGITAELEAYSRAGLGGVEITPIYGVHGYESQFVQFLSREWMDLLVHTLREAERLNLGVDMATGTGWPFGGPWVSEEDACKNIYHKIYSLKGGERLKQKISFIQPPYLRAVGSQVYEVHDNAEEEGRQTQGSRKEPVLKYDPANIKIENIKQPVASNPDLQSLALDQVQFEKPLPLIALVAYGGNGEAIILTDRVSSDGNLDWTAPPGGWQLYAIFQGWHGKMVERAGPGGEGNVIDHFSSEALRRYLQKFDSAFANNDIKSMRGFFNDSYEVDDARGAADWTPELLAEFKNKRGYDLLRYLPALFGNDESDLNERILYDYRLTISELLLENFTRPWSEWAHAKQKIVRNQAHGAPANILDLYSVVDIPETEGVEPLRIRMASSAGHVSGKKLISSESATWLDEHFLSNLGDIKANVDRYLINGVNHVLYHGTSYSPPGEPWPGWLFYAAVHLNPRNPQWADFAALNRYIARCQAFLQQGVADNDILLYYPIADRLSSRGPEMVEHFDSPNNNFKESSFLRIANQLMTRGYTFDFVSDRQILDLRYENKQLTTTAGGKYKTLVIPPTTYFPLETLDKINALAKSGLKVIVVGHSPEKVAGLELDRGNQFFSSIAELKSISLSTPDEQSLATSLLQAEVKPEPMVGHGLVFTRRKLGNDQTLYLINNPTEKRIEDWISLSASGRYAIIRDPMKRLGGLASIRNDEGLSAYLKLEPGQCLLLELTDANPHMNAFPIYEPDGDAIELTNWSLTFDSGGPHLPAPSTFVQPKPWTALAENEYHSFSGTATYSTQFEKPQGSPGTWLLEFSDIHESATIFLNGDSLATLIAPPFEVVLKDAMLSSSNELSVRVSNLMANRISDLDQRGVAWKKFYNVNFPSRKPENRVNGLFNSSGWKPMPSGMEGPVFLSPISAAKPSF